MKKINKTVIINPGKNKFTFMNKKLVFQILLLISLLTVFAYFVNNKQSGEVIVVGTGNPGKIFVYDYNSFQRKEIDTGFKLVHTVRIGDAFNDGKNVIVAGVSNSFYGPPYGCEVILLDPSNNFKESLVDNVGDLRCKDLTIGDADNDGRNEIVLGTHGEGTINIYKWDGKWKKQEVEKNFIKQVDEKEGVNHRVPVEKLTYDTVEQSAVHIVKIGDIDNDKHNEVMIVVKEASYPWRRKVIVYSGNGIVEWEKYLVSSVTYATAPALADLDGDDVPEIIIQSNDGMDIITGNGDNFPNWPISWSGRALGYSSPVVGDVDGDSDIEIVITTEISDSLSRGELRVYNSDGSLAHLQELPIERGAVPAIADIDLDGRNEILVTGSYWNGVTGYFDKVWAFDLGGAKHGSIEWGQFGRDASHTGLYQ